MNLLPHLVESTLFAVAVWLVTLALHRNRARTRHTLWMAASLKFVIPFSLVVFCGSLMRRHPAPVASPQMRFVMVETAVPMSSPAAIPSRPAAARRDWLPAILGTIWLCGSLAIMLRWYARWRSAVVHLRYSCPWEGRPLPVPVRSSESLLEPAVFGIFRPVLLLPAAIEQRLSASQLGAVLAHELCHVRHRDNLAAALHMLVEALFWFHPLVWWIGARLVEERERASDEEVLQLGSDRAVYAESIVRVCELCLEAPVPCVSGITGADLKLRIRNIMTASVHYQLEPRKKLLLATLGIASIAVPLAIGLLHPAKMRAQSPLIAEPAHFEAASLKYAEDQNILEARPKRTIGRFRWKTQLMYLVGYAWHMEWWRISDIAGSNLIYELEATTPPNATENQVRLMLQTLLVERFKMVAHRQIKEAVDGYALTAGKITPKLQEVKEDDSDPFVATTSPAGGVCLTRGHAASMLQVVEHLQRLLSTAVLDQTAMTGKYDFEIEYPRGEDSAHCSEVIGGVKQLGLKMEKYKGPVEFLVVDHMEKRPTEN